VEHEDAREDVTGEPDDLRPPPYRHVDWFDASWDRMQPRPLVYRAVLTEEAASIARTGIIAPMVGPRKRTPFYQDHGHAVSSFTLVETDPARTGQPAFVLEVERGPDIVVDGRDFTPKAHAAIPASRIRRAWRHDPNRSVVPVAIHEGAWTGVMRWPTRSQQLPTAKPADAPRRRPRT
jgi:hypothetical protein